MLLPCLLPYLDPLPTLSCGSRYPQPPFATCIDAGWGALTIFPTLARVLARADGGDHGGGSGGSAVPVTVEAMADAFEGWAW